MLQTSKRNWKLFEKSLGTEARVDDSPTRLSNGATPSWTVVETQNLPGLLFPGVSMGDAFPGIVARRMTDTPGLAALGYGLEAQSVLALTTPVTLGRISVDEAAAAFQELFRLATQIAERMGCQWLRCLVPCSETPQNEMIQALQSALSLFDFSCLADIGEWCCEYSTEQGEESRLYVDRPDVAFETVSPAQLGKASFHDEINELLENILSASSDLPNLPRAVASDMISRWLNAGTEILLLRVRSMPAGICAFEKASEEGLIDPFLTVRLQYAGVVPEMRQRGLGRCLIQALVSNCLKQHSRIVLVVTADRSNTAAVRLYESLRFQIQSIHGVWMKRIVNQVR